MTSDVDMVYKKVAIINMVYNFVGDIFYVNSFRVLNICFIFLDFEIQNLEFLNQVSIYVGKRKVAYIKKSNRVQTPAIRWLNAVHTGIRTVVASSTLTRASQPGKSPLAKLHIYIYVPLPRRTAACNAFCPFCPDKESFPLLLLSYSVLIISPPF
jgi:hypothetical protein